MRTALLDLSRDRHGRGILSGCLAPALHSLRREGVLLPLEVPAEQQSHGQVALEQWQLLAGKLNTRERLEQVLVFFDAELGGPPRLRSRVPRILDIWQKWIAPIFAQPLEEGMRDLLSDELLVRFVSIGDGVDEASLKFELQGHLDENDLLNSQRGCDTDAPAPHDPLERETLLKWAWARQEYKDLQAALSSYLKEDPSESHAVNSGPKESANAEKAKKAEEAFVAFAHALTCHFDVDFKSVVLPRKAVPIREQLEVKIPEKALDDKITQNLTSFIKKSAGHFFGLPGLETFFNECVGERIKARPKSRACLELLHIDPQDEPERHMLLVGLLGGLCATPAVKDEGDGILRVESLRDGGALELRRIELKVSSLVKSQRDQFDKSLKGYLGLLSKLQSDMRAQAEAEERDRRAQAEAEKESQTDRSQSRDDAWGGKLDLSGEPLQKVSFPFWRNAQPKISDILEGLKERREQNGKIFKSEVEKRRDARIGELWKQAREVRDFLDMSRNNAEHGRSSHWSDRRADEGRSSRVRAGPGHKERQLETSLSSLVNRQAALNPVLVSAAVISGAVLIGTGVAAVSNGLPDRASLLAAIPWVFGGLLLAAPAARWQSQTGLGRAYNGTVDDALGSEVDFQQGSANFLGETFRDFHHHLKNSVKAARDSQKKQRNRDRNGARKYYLDEAQKISDLLMEQFFGPDFKPEDSVDDLNEMTQKLLPEDGSSRLDLRQLWQIEQLDLHLKLESTFTLGTSKLVVDGVVRRDAPGIVQQS